MILPCNCTHEYQDKQYGKGMRVHNPTFKDLKQYGNRCTVCSNVKAILNRKEK